MLLGCLWNFFIGHLCLFGVLIGGLDDGFIKSGWFYKVVKIALNYIVVGLIALIILSSLLLLIAAITQFSRQVLLRRLVLAALICSASFVAFLIILQLCFVSSGAPEGMLILGLISGVIMFAPLLFLLKFDEKAPVIH